MKSLKTMINFLVHSLLIVWFVGFSMVFTALTILNFQIDFRLPIAFALIFFSLYAINRRTDIKEDETTHKDRSEFIKKYGRYVFKAGLISYPLAFLIALSINMITALTTLIPLILGLLYSVRWIPQKAEKKIGFRRLKDVFIIKNLTIAFTWSFSLVVMIITYVSMNLFSYDIIFIFIFFFMRVFINTVMFDLRDAEGDKMEGMKTIPIFLGKEKTKMLLYILNLFLALIIFYYAGIGIINPIMYIINLSAIYSIFYIYIFDKNYINKDFLCDVIIDGEFIFIAFLTIIAQTITYL